MQIPINPAASNNLEIWTNPAWWKDPHILCTPLKKARNAALRSPNMREMSLRPENYESPRGISFPSDGQHVKPLGIAGPRSYDDPTPRARKVREPRHQHGWLGRDLLETPALLTLRLTRLDVFFGVLDLECKGKAQFKEWSPDTESKASNFHRKRSTTSGHGGWSWKSKIELSGKSFSNLTFYGLYVRVQGFKVSFKTMVFFVLPTLKYIPKKIDDEIAD